MGSIKKYGNVPKVPLTYTGIRIALLDVCQVSHKWAKISIFCSFQGVMVVSNSIPDDFGASFLSVLGG